MTGSSGAPHVAVFLPPGSTLAHMDRAGLLGRQLTFYGALLPHLPGMTLVTHGGPEDAAYEDRLPPGLRLIHNRWRLPDALYPSYVRWRYRALWSGDVVLEAAGVEGARLPLRLAWAYRRPFVAHIDALPSLAVELERGADSSAAVWARDLEREVLRRASVIAATAAELTELAARRYRIDPAETRIVPPAVDADRFRPEPMRVLPDRLCVLGRWRDRASVDGLVGGLASLEVELVFVDHDADHAFLEGVGRAHGVTVHAPPRSGPELPEVLNTAVAALVPPSWEARPVELLEAMACGVPVVVPGDHGVASLVRDGETGVVYEGEAHGLRVALGTLLADAALLDRLGRAARAEVEARFALSRVVERKLEALRQAAARPVRPRTAVDRHPVVRAGVRE